MRLSSASLLLAAAALSVAQAPPPSPIAAALQPYVDSHTLAGAVTLVASRDRVLGVDTVGWADIAAKQPMRAEALFWIASMSKPMTAAAFMILVDEGKVRIDDPVEKYLPEFKQQWLAVEQDQEHVLLRRPAHPITIRNILTHTSGMPATSAMETPTLDLLPLRDAVRSYAMTPLQFAPDSQYRYANSGINTAGRIIEVVSGMAYERFLEERLFAPLGMHDTTFWPSEAQVRRVAKSYAYNEAKQDLEETTVSQLFYPLTDRKRRYPMPAGGLFSTAADVARFCRMVLAGGTLDGKRILSEDAVRQMTSLQTADLPVNNSDATGYGFGWSVQRKAAADGRAAGSFGHGGAYKTLLWIDPPRQLIFILMRQQAGNLPAAAGGVEPAFVKAAIARYGRP